MEDTGDQGPDRAAVSRMCIVTRVVRPVSDMIRFVAGPDGMVVPDIKARLPGRGVWLTNSRAVLAQAIKRKLFQRGLKESVTVPTSLEDQVAGLLKRDALQMLAIANKAGTVTSGFAKIEGMRGPVLALVQASDGSGAEIARLQGLCRSKGPGKREPVLVRAFAAEEIALSIGREHVIHAALTVHDAASVFLDRASRFMEFQAGSPAKPEQVSTSGLSGFPESPHQNKAGPEADKS
jgi:uncharacterized protein